MGNLLQLIEDGLVSTTRMPPSSSLGLDFRDRETEATWLAEQNALLMMDAIDFIRYAQQEYTNRYASEQNIGTAIKNDITRQLLEMQRRPPFINHYRRFVVIGDPSEERTYALSTEWVRVSTPILTTQSTDSHLV
jgi:hypothetical protein